MTTTTIKERFEAKVATDPESGCVLWEGALNSNGYGHIKVNGKVVKAHRWAFEQTYGPIPQGMVLDHIVCRTRSCCNPAHLRVVTPRQNTLENSIGFAAANAAKTHCKRLHEFDDENTRIRPEGGRACRTCRALHNRLYWLLNEASDEALDKWEDQFLTDHPEMGMTT